MNGMLCGSSGGRCSGGDGIYLSLTPFQIRLYHAVNSLDRLVSSAYMLERGGLFFEMGHVPRRETDHL